MVIKKTLLIASALLGAARAQYLLGLGIGDITGPVVETNMMGYASLGQTDTGLHMRQRARAFIVADAASPGQRVLFINLDVGMGDTGIRRGVLAGLAPLYGGAYTGTNTALVGTHQHSGVGGYVENLLPQLTSLGFVPAAYNAIVAGTLLAVARAHASLAPGSLAIGNTTIPDGNLNRSPFAYLQNPAAERARYATDTDKDFTLLRFASASNVTRGFLSFFAVHGTSLYENNTLVSGDNKGMAAYLFESSVEPTAMPGATTFVAGFAQSNVGDTTPNTGGAYCESPGKPWDGQLCDFRTSTCGNATEDCHGRGPAFQVSDFASNAIIGNLQAAAAHTVLAAPLTAISGTVRSAHQYVDMSNYAFTLANGTAATTCPAALGFSFAGGTTDGPGAFDFTQGDNNTVQNPLWEIVKTVITPPPSPAQVACHAPKPILLNTGFALSPYAWQPSVVDIQILRVGQLVMLVFPGELTTMSGRRMRELIRAQLIAQGVLGSNAYVVVAGPANTYAHYVATREEYAVQRYEGASTLYGPFTLEAYMDIFSKLTPQIADTPSGPAPPSAAPPPNLTGNAISLQTGVVFDAPQFLKHFGDVLTNVNTATPYAAGATVSATFVGADPRNNLRLEGTFLSVDALQGGAWTPVRSDSHPSTTFQWVRTSTILGQSSVTISWTIESGTPAGSYRLTYNGDSKPLIGSISSLTGHSGTFTVSA